MTGTVAGTCSECGRYDPHCTVLIAAGCFNSEYLVCGVCVSSPHPCEKCGKRPCRCEQNEFPTKGTTDEDAGDGR